MHLTKKNWRGTKNCLKHCHMNALRTKSNYGMLQQIPYIYLIHSNSNTDYDNVFTRLKLLRGKTSNSDMKPIKIWKCISTWHTYSCQPTRAWQISVFSVKITLDIFGSKTGHNRDTLQMPNFTVFYHNVVLLYILLNVFQRIQNCVPSANNLSAILIQLPPTFIAFQVLLLKASLQIHPREKEANHMILRPHYALEKDVACSSLFLYCQKLMCWFHYYG